MSRETEKLLEAFRRFMDLHADDAADAAAVNALAEQFLAEHDQKCAAQEDGEPENTDDHPALAEQETPKKTCIKYFHGTVELETKPNGFEMTICTTERHSDSDEPLCESDLNQQDNS